MVTITMSLLACRWDAHLSCDTFQLNFAEKLDNHIDWHEMDSDFMY